MGEEVWCWDFSSGGRHVVFSLRGVKMVLIDVLWCGNTILEFVCETVMLENIIKSGADSRSSDNDPPGR